MIYCYFLFRHLSQCNPLFSYSTEIDLLPITFRNLLRKENLLFDLANCTSVFIFVKKNGKDYSPE